MPRYALHNGMFPNSDPKYNVLQNRDRWTFINVLGSQNFMRDIRENVNKLVSELKMAQSPEAMVYLRLLGNELGYLTTTDMEGVANTAAVMVDSMFKMFQTDVITGFLFSHINADHLCRNDLFNCFMGIVACHS